jgi:hypothetical protein
MGQASSNSNDPCAEFTSVQRNALIWFVVVIGLGLFLTTRFALIDRWMYDNNAEFLDPAAKKENRYAQGAIQSERLDPRQGGDLMTAIAKTNPSKP